jgi:hypothetical protein
MCENLKIIIYCSAMSISTLVLHSGGRKFKSSDDHVHFILFKYKSCFTGNLSESRQKITKLVKASSKTAKGAKNLYDG